MKNVIFDIDKKKEPRGFGINDRYSLRTRIPPLRKELGERAIYCYTKYGPELIALKKLLIHVQDLITSIMKQRNK